MYGLIRRGDEIWQYIHVGGEPELCALAGYRVKVKFEIDNAKLYAMQFVVLKA